jgi:hypothetical protein
MKNTLVKSIGATALALLLVGGVQLFGSGQSSGRHERSIEGAWRTTVTIRNCQTGAPITTFPGLQTFNEGGTLAEIATGGPPSSRTPGHGVWKREHGSQNYSFVFMFDRFNADGTYAGSQKVRGAVVLEASGDELTVAATTEIFNPAGQLIATGCSTATAARIE